MYQNGPPNASAAKFMTVENLKACEAKFRRVMSNNYGLSFDSPQDTADLRRMMYSEMQLVASNARPNDTVQGLNKVLLNATRDAVLESHNRNARPPLQQQQSKESPYPQRSTAATPNLAMQRDRDVYGVREVQYNTMLPETRLPGPTEEVTRRFEAANQRYEPPSMPTNGNEVARLTQIVSPMDAGEFETRLADRLAEMQLQMQQDQQMQMQQQQQQQPIPSLPNSGGPFVVQPPPDALAVVRKSQEDADEFKRMSNHPIAAPTPLTFAGPQGTSMSPGMGGAIGPIGPMIPHPASATMIPGGPLMSSRNETLIASPKVTQVIPRYITVNGADREVSVEPYRYQFTVRTGGRQSIATLQSSYTNVAWLEVTRVILPQEIMSALGTAATISGNYNTEYSFAFPYLLIKVDGIDDVCDGTNDAMRKAFSTLVYVTEYKAPNGRGYVSLAPGQLERKVYTSPMSSLPDLKISILKPNGTLFNSSQDAYTVSGTLPTVSAANANYMVITTDQFFDRNELWVGDNVTLSGLVLKATSASNTIYVSALQQYLTQTAGLEIVDLPQTTNSFYNGVCVRIPGLFNQATGAIVPDPNITSILKNGTFTITSPGIVMNTSLQAVVMMTAGIVTGAGLPPPNL